MSVFGISSRFQLLSPCKGQVTHALLTRPPLTSKVVFRRIRLRSSVRLACVKHAASVRPEPGSNSPCKIFIHMNNLICSYQLSVSTHKLIFLSLVYLAHLTQVLTLQLSILKTRIHHYHLNDNAIPHKLYCSVPKDRFIECNYSIC